MPLLARRPVTVPMYFVRPHVKPGDYYLIINPINGRRMWVYPRHIGERNYAVTSALGSDFEDTAQSIQEMTNLLVNQALTTAQQVQQGAEQIQEGSFVPQESPVQVTNNPSGPFTPNGIFMFGIGALAALGLAYWYIKRGKWSTTTG